MMGDGSRAPDAAKPWEAAGMSRATWYRRRAAERTATEAQPAPEMQDTAAPAPPVPDDETVIRHLMSVGRMTEQEALRWINQHRPAAPEPPPAHVLQNVQDLDDDARRRVEDKTPSATGGQPCAAPANTTATPPPVTRCPATGSRCARRVHGGHDGSAGPL